MTAEGALPSPMPLTHSPPGEFWTCVCFSWLLGVDNGHTFQFELTHPLLFPCLPPFPYFPFFFSAGWAHIWRNTIKRRGCWQQPWGGHSRRGMHVFCSPSRAPEWARSSASSLWRLKCVVEVCVGSSPTPPQLCRPQGKADRKVRRPEHSLP